MAGGRDSGWRRAQAVEGRLRERLAVELGGQAERLEAEHSARLFGVIKQHSEAHAELEAELAAAAAALGRERARRQALRDGA
eukprot:SAG11_NODE_16801_length_537_cov_1.002283_2_plen_81_part_01